MRASAIGASKNKRFNTPDAIKFSSGWFRPFTRQPLLCQRHHTIVHRDHLAGHLTNGTITWDLRPGSYDEQLTRKGHPPDTGDPPPCPRAA